MMVRFDKVVIECFSASVIVIALYEIAGCDIAEPCASYGFLVLTIACMEWIREKALKLRKSNREN